MKSSETTTTTAAPGESSSAAHKRPRPSSSSSPAAPAISNPSSNSVSCLDDSIVMLQATMLDQTAAFEYLLDRSPKCENNNECPDDYFSPKDGDATASQTDAAATTLEDDEVNSLVVNDGGGVKRQSSAAHLLSPLISATTSPTNKPNSWWMSVLHSLQQQHEQDKTVWQAQVQRAKLDKHHYKAQLHETLQSRLSFLEQQVQTTRVLHEEEEQHTHTTVETSSGESSGGGGDGDGLIHPAVGSSSNGSSLESHPHDADADDDAATAAMNVVVTGNDHGDGPDSNNNLHAQHVHELQSQLQALRVQHEHEKAAWQQQQIMPLAKSKHREKAKVLQQLLQLVEQQHQAEQREWEHERLELLTQHERIKSQLLMTKPKQPQTKSSLQQSPLSPSRRVHFLARDSAEESPSLSLSVSPPASPLSSSPTSHRRRQSSPTTTGTTSAPADDALVDRLMCERDLYQQEAAAAQQSLAQLQQQVDEERALHLQELVQAEQQWQHDTATQMQTLQAEHVQELLLATASLQDSADHRGDGGAAALQAALAKKNEVTFQLRQLEQQHARQKHAWKLQLEAERATARRAQRDQQQIDRLYQQLKTTLPTHGGPPPQHQQQYDLQHLRDMLDETTAAYDAELAALQTRCDSIRETLQREHVAEMDELRRQHQHALEAAQQQAQTAVQQALEQQDRRHQRELAAREKALADQKGHLQKSNDAIVDELKREHQTELSQQRTQNEKEIQKLQLKNHEVLKTMQQTHETELQEWKDYQTLMQQEFQSKLETLSSVRDETRDKVCEQQRSDRQAYNEQLESLQLAHAQEVEELQRRCREIRADSNTKLESLRQAQALDLQQWKHRASRHSQDRDGRFESLQNRCDDLEAQLALAGEQRAAKLRELQASHDAFLEKMMATHAKEIQEWEIRFDQAVEESLQRMKELQGQHDEDVAGWKDYLETEQAANDALIQQLKDDHEKELGRLKNTYSQERGEWSKETSVLTQQTNEFTASLEELHTAHSQAKKKYDGQIKRLTAEKEHYVKLVEELKARDIDGPHSPRNHWKNLASSLDLHHRTIGNMVDDLRQDFKAVQESFESSSKADRSIENANYAELRQDMQQVQSTLNEAVAELALEAEAMIDSRASIQALTTHATTAFPTADDFKTLVSQQDRSLRDIQAIGKQVKNIQSSEAHRRGVDSVKEELVAELQKRETLCTALREESKQLKAAIEAEIAMRQRAEQEVRLLNDQADTYSEEVMRLQAVKARLEETLREAEGKIQTALMSKSNRYHDRDDEEIEFKPSTASDDTDSPLLEAALHLAKGLNDVVHGRGQMGERSVMEILETLSDMMDEHERAVSFCASAEGRGDAAPAPVMSPRDDMVPLSPANAGEHHSKLEMVVDQLYARCALLERERTDLMNVTLDLLESAKEANHAEMDAALATVRRKSAEELMRVRQESHNMQWCLFHKVCQRCQKGLLSSQKQSNDVTMTSQGNN